MCNAAVHPAVSPTLSAWEMWLVNKAKEERLKLEKKAEEASHFSWFACFSHSKFSFIITAHDLNLWPECFHPYMNELGALTKRKNKTARKGAGTEKDCHGGQDSRMAQDEKTTGTELLLQSNKQYIYIFNHAIKQQLSTVICLNFSYNPRRRMINL